jgi:formate/nitrite transporter FocA (FNT family)
MARTESQLQTDEAYDEQEDTTPGATSEPTAGTRLTAREIYHNVRVAAEEEMKRPLSGLFWSALTCGLVIGFSFLAAGYLALLAPPTWHTAAAAAGYPLGFIFVVLARNQLFTENTLEPIIPLLHRPSWKTLRHLLELWVVVLIGNLIGNLIFSVLLARTALISDPTFESVLKEVARQGTSGGFGLVLYQGIYGGWLIALMAWLLSATPSTGAQLVLIWLTTAPIAAFGFRHSIAGSVEAFYLAWAGLAGWKEMWLDFVVPAVLGNIVGGVLLVALLNHGQIMAGRKARGE